MELGGMEEKEGSERERERREEKRKEKKTEKGERKQKEFYNFIDS